MRSRTETDIAPTGRRQQAATGLFLTAAIFAAWLALHLYAMFGFVLSWSSLPLALILAVLLCWLSVGMFIASHDAMHGSLVPGGGAINDWVGGFLLFVYAGFGWKRMRAMRSPRLKRKQMSKHRGNNSRRRDRVGTRLALIVSHHVAMFF